MVGVGAGGQQLRQGPGVEWMKGSDDLDVKTTLEFQTA